MKKVIKAFKAISLYAAIMFFCYLMAAFARWEINAGEWSVDARAAYIIFGNAASLFFTCFYIFEILNKKTDKKD